MELITRHGFKEKMSLIYGSTCDIRALAKATAANFRANSEILISNLNALLNFDEIAQTDFLYTTDGGIYSGDSVKDALETYLNTGEYVDVVALNDSNIKHNCYEIVSDTKKVIDSNICYGNAFDMISRADENTSISASDFNATNEANGVAISELYGYSYLVSVLADNQLSIEEKYVLISNSLNEDSISSQSGLLISDFSKNQYGLGPFAAWAIQFLGKIIQVDWSNAVTIVVSAVRSAWNAIAAVGHAIENFVGRIFNKYVLNGEVFDANLSSSRNNYLTIPVDQFYFNDSLSIVMDLGTFATFSQRCIYSILMNDRDTPVGMDIHASKHIRVKDIKFLILKFAIIGMYYNVELGRFEGLIYLLPSDTKKISDYIMKPVNSITVFGVNVPNMVPFSQVLTNYESEADGVSMNFYAAQGSSSAIQRIFTDHPVNYIFDLLCNTNLDNYNNISDQNLYSGLLFSYYKLKVLIKYISNYDLLSGLSSVPSPQINTSGSPATTDISYQHLSKEMSQMMSVLFNHILGIHGTEYVLEDATTTFSRTYDFSLNTYKNDWSDDVELLANLYASGVGTGYTYSVANFLKFMKEPHSLNTSISGYAAPSFLNGQFTVATSSGWETITDNFLNVALPAVNRYNQDLEIALLHLLFYSTSNDLINTDTSCYGLTDYSKMMPITPSINSLTSIVNPGISLLTSDDQASRFRSLLLVVGITAAVIAIGITIGNTVIAFRSKVLTKNIEAETKYFKLTQLQPGTTQYQQALAEAQAATVSATRWNSFSAAIGGTSLSQSANLSGLIKNDSSDSKLNRIISLISDS